MKPQADVIEAPEDLMPFFFDFAALMYGPEVAKAALRIYGNTTDPANVPDSHWYNCQARFLLLMNHELPPLPPVTEAPRVANTPMEARLLKLEFAEAKRRRQAKAAQLWDALEAACDAANLDGADISHVLGDSGYGARTDAKVWCMNGLAGMTYGTFKNPCIRGLKELEAILKAAPVIGPDRSLFEDAQLNRDLEPVRAAYWNVMDNITDPESDEGRRADGELSRTYAKQYAAFQKRWMAKHSREFG
jgi:hypothetical protein